jgi:hypothetical protein
MANVSAVNALRVVQVLFVLASLILLFIAVDEVDNAREISENLIPSSSLSTTYWECTTEPRLQDGKPAGTSERCESEEIPKFTDAFAHQLNAIIDGLAALTCAAIAVALRPSSRSRAVDGSEKR